MLYTHQVFQLFVSAPNDTWSDSCHEAQLRFLKLHGRKVRRVQIAILLNEIPLPFVVEADGGLRINDVHWDEEEEVLHESKEPATRFCDLEVVETCVNYLRETVGGLVEGRTQSITELQFGLSAVDFEGADDEDLERNMPTWAIDNLVDLTQGLSRLQPWVGHVENFVGGEWRNHTTVEKIARAWMEEGATTDSLREKFKQEEKAPN